MLLKALDRNMRAIHGNCMKYEIGKMYSIHGDISECQTGFHYCQDLKNVLRFYDLSEVRIFEVEVGKQNLYSDGKFTTESIRLIRELNDKELAEIMIKEGFNQYWINLQNRLSYIHRDMSLNVYMQNTTWRIKVAVAYQNKPELLDVLVSDEYPEVRIAVASCGRECDLIKLIHDKDKDVRKTAQMILSQMA